MIGFHLKVRYYTRRGHSFKWIPTYFKAYSSKVFKKRGWMLVGYKLLIKVPFNWKDRGYMPESHLYLIRFFPVFFGYSFKIVLYFLDFFQNYIAFWFLTSSFSVEWDFNFRYSVLKISLTKNRCPNKAVSYSINKWICVFRKTIKFRNSYELTF